MKIILNNKLTLQNIPDFLEPELIDSLTFLNPSYLENQKMKRWNGKTPKSLKYYERIEGGLIIPRGYTGQLLNLCRGYGVKYYIEDQRRILPEVEFDFNGALKPFQDKAVRVMLKKDFGTLSAPTGTGKTVMALFMIAQRKQPALIVVHTRELLNQWVDRISTFMDIPKNEIGVIGDGKKSIGSVTVALVQSLYKISGFVSEHIGHVVIDECQRAPSRTFTEAVTAFDSTYTLGLSATPWRRDKLSKLIFWHVGEVHHSIGKRDLVESGDILEIEVITRNTDFKPFSNPVTEYSKMLSELTQDDQRNLLIASDVALESKNGGGVCLVLSDRKAHCLELYNLLMDRFNIESALLTGDVPAKERQHIVGRLNQGKIKVLISTNQLLAEGFDCRNLATLFMTTPIKYSGRVLQVLGRILRPAPGKKALVYMLILMSAFWWLQENQGRKCI